MRRVASSEKFSLTVVKFTMVHRLFLHIILLSDCILHVINRYIICILLVNGKIHRSIFYFRQIAEIQLDKDFY